MALWLTAVLVGTGIAGLRGRLPGVEPRPYIIRFTEDKPNPLYRRVCYTFAWSALVTYAALNAAGNNVIMVDILRHPDPRAERVRHQITEAALLQALASTPKPDSSGKE
jgi:hypothetical protein